MRLVDVLCLSKDERGVIRVGPECIGAHVSSVPAGATLWQLLIGGDADQSPVTPLDLRSAAEIGLDLAAVEHLQYRIEPGTSALLILTEAVWENELLEVAAATGGVPIVSGCLEPETMLLVGPAVAMAAEASEAAERAGLAHGEAVLDTLAHAVDPASNLAGSVLQVLVDAHLIDHLDVDEAIDALATVSLVPSSVVPRVAGPSHRSDEREGR